MRIGVGIIGWGFMGKTHAHALREIGLFYPGAEFEVEIVSVCSRRLGMAQDAAKLLGAKHYCDDYKELLARDDIDVVSICTPNELHEQMALAAIDMGKHVYLDKPVAPAPQAAMRIAKAASDRGIIAQTVFNNRFFPATIRAKQLMDEGKIGEILSFSCRYLHSGSIDANRPAGWKQLQGAGVLQDLGSHALDMLTWLIGYPARVNCKLRTLYRERPTAGGSTTALGDDHALMMLEYANGAIGTVEASKIHTGIDDELRFEISGTKGAMRFNLMNPNYLEYFDNTLPDLAYGGERGFLKIACVARYEKPAGAFLPPKNTIGWDRAHIHCYYSFLDCVAKGVAATPDLLDGAKVQALMGICAQSSASGKWVTWDGGEGT